MRAVCFCFTVFMSVSLLVFVCLSACVLELFISPVSMSGCAVLARPLSYPRD